MKVRELIELLEKENPEYDVVVSGYEGGVTDVEDIGCYQVKCNFNNAWYYGPHEALDKGEQYAGETKWVVHI